MSLIKWIKFLLHWGSDKKDMKRKWARKKPCVSSPTISPDLVSKNALKVLDKIEKSGYKAYLVGGCVRDILLGIAPKDFDIATDAHPEQVRKIFRNSRIIGRRFRLIHVVFGREIIEVATFRANPVADTANPDALKDQQTGRILRDNVFGTIEEDASRRDFTVNALYYSFHSSQLLDFSTGKEDLTARVLRLLGNPVERYHEDPVRMLRAVRFAAKLGFDLHQETEEPLARLSGLLREVPASRLFDEVLKLFLTGHGLKSYAALKKYRLLSFLFPDFSRIVSENKRAAILFELALKSTDNRLQKGKSVTPTFLYAAILWYPLLHYHTQIMQKKRVQKYKGWDMAISHALTSQVHATSIPKRFIFGMQDIWKLQELLVHRSGKAVRYVTTHPRFRAAYDFLLLREASGEDLNQAGKWWTEYQEKHPITAVRRRR